MKRYETLRSLLVYPQNSFVPPKGERPGFGNCLFLLSPSRQKGNELVNSNFLNYRVGLYKNFMIDFIYKEKVGYKKYSKNNTGAFKKEFSEMDTSGTLRMVNNGNRVTILQSRRNLIVNLGEWFDIFLQHQIKSSTKKICYNFCKFLSEKVNDGIFSMDAELPSYKKIVYIDIDQWLTTTNKLSFDRRDLINPVAILLVTLYKFPEYFTELNLKEMDYVFVTPSGSKIMKVSGEDLIKKKYTILKQKLITMVNEHVVDNANLDESRILDEEPVPDKPRSEMTTQEFISSVKSEKAKEQKKTRDAILNNLTKNLLGNPEDITEEDDDTPIETDDDTINEIRNIGNNYIDEHPEILEKDIEEATKEVSGVVNKRYYKREYEPKYTDEQLKKMQELAKLQKTAIDDLDESITDPKSKIIDESDFSNVVKTTNPNIESSKFVNFDRAYNEKKFKQDINNMVGMLAKANPPVFVKSMKEEDTSTSLTYKKTMTYDLEDINGNKMVLKFDIPVIFEDHFMMLNGNKKVIQHILILNPIVKTGKDTVQIVSNYQKMFIMLHGSVDLKTTALLRYLTKNHKTYEVIGGNGIVTNKYYKSTMDYNGIARKIIQFRVNDALFILDGAKIHEMIEKGVITPPAKMDFNKQFIIGIDSKSNPIVMSTDESFVDKVYQYMEPETIEEIQKYARKANGGKLLQYATTKPLQKEIPLILLLFYFESFKTVMEKAGIEYELIPKDENGSTPDVDIYEWGLTEMEDGWIKWKRYPAENSFLMNGMNPLPMHLYSIHDLDNKDTYTYLLTNYYTYANQTFNLDQYYDFMIDPITKEILIDKGLPTNLVDLCILAVKMLKSDEFTPEGDLRNMRIRSNEIIAYHLYKKLTDAFRSYRRTQHRSTPLPISLPRDAVIKDILDQPASAMNDASSLNPVLEISKLRAVTYKGESGTNEEHAFKLGVRAYNESMLGVLGQTTSPDSGVGINRQMSLEPNITSTRGYIDVAGNDHVEDLNGAQLLAPSDLLTPLGALHDDPARTSMAYKQTMYMVLTDESDPVLIGNGVEKVLPYHLSSDFCITAEEDGVVVEETDEFTVVRYKSGKFRTIDKMMHVKKNSASGFYIQSQLTTDLKLGDKFKKNTVIAWDNKAFKKNADSSASMRLGPLMKIAIVPEWDIYEDSAPLTYGAAERLATTIVMPVTVTLNSEAFVSRIVNVGDKVNAGDTLILFDNYHDDPDVMAIIQSRRKEEVEELVENYSTREESHYTGTICEIEVTTTVPVKELSESLQKIVKQYWKKLKRRDAILDKYSNEDDLNFYKSGNAITSTPQPVKPDAHGKVKGKMVEKGVVITFYIAFRDVLSKGDKFSSEFALKSTNSHIIDKGLEPYAESRPDEPIDLITAPLSISARKTPSIFIAMFGNKILIEEKRKLKEYWESN